MGLLELSGAHLLLVSERLSYLVDVEVGASHLYLILDLFVPGLGGVVELGRDVALLLVDDKFGHAVSVLFDVPHYHTLMGALHAGGHYSDAAGFESGLGSLLGRALGHHQLAHPLDVFIKLLLPSCIRGCSHQGLFLQHARD